MFMMIYLMKVAEENKANAFIHVSHTQICIHLMFIFMFYVCVVCKVCEFKWPFKKQRMLNPK